MGIKRVSSMVLFVTGLLRIAPQPPESGDVGTSVLSLSPSEARPTRLQMAGPGGTRPAQMAAIGTRRFSRDDAGSDDGLNQLMNSRISKLPNSRRRHSSWEARFGPRRDI